MQVGDLVKVIKNDMSLVVKRPGPKDNKFFDQIGTVIKIYEPAKWEVANPWYGVLFAHGYYEARKDALMLISQIKKETL